MSQGTGARSAARCDISDLLNVVAIVMACAAVGGFPPPHVNEAHYLTKALHRADPTFAAGDLFLASADAHWLFAVVFGRLSRVMALPTLALCGRLAGWLSLSVSWIVLFRTLGLRGWRAFAAGTLLIWFTFATPMAGEWMVGGIEAKVFSFACGTLALSAWAGRRPGLALLSAGAATAWHPLVGGWLGLLLGGAVLVAEGPGWFIKRRALLALSGASLLAAIGVVPALRLTFGLEPHLVRQAARIYVDIRLGHHLVFQRLDGLAILRHGAAWIAFLLLWWRSVPGDARLQRLALIVWGSALLSVVGMVLSGLFAWWPDAVAPWLRFYWFRTADWVLPVGLAAFGWCWLMGSDRYRGGWRTSVIVLAALFPILDISVGALSSDVAWRYPPAMRQSHLLRGRLHRWDEVVTDWKNTCRWIASHTEYDAVFLTPRYQQTFKWYAGRAEVVNWKDVPQDAAGLIEWWRRFQAVYPAGSPRRALADHAPAERLRLARRYGARYAVIDARRSPEGLPWTRIYPNHDDGGLFWVYRVPADESQGRP